MRYVMLALVLLSVGCGAKGRQGDTGAPGANALPCTVTAVPEGAMIACPNGSSQLITNGLDGLQGIQGLPGAVGATGPAGAAGLDATPVTTVQFCPGYQESYPSTFPEFALVISGQIYAVYDGGANDVFLALIAPGTYSSTSTSAPCNFTVQPDGTITHG